MNENTNQGNLKEDLDKLRRKLRKTSVRNPNYKDIEESIANIKAKMNSTA
jgi:hypothetical protein